MVVDRGVLIPEGLVVGEDPALDAKRFRRTETGVCLITQPMIDRPLSQDDLEEARRRPSRRPRARQRPTAPGALLAARGRAAALFAADPATVVCVRLMRVLSVASEIYPLIKTGGLADVAGALPPALARRGIEMRTLVPGYPAVMARLGTPRVVYD